MKACAYLFHWEALRCLFASPHALRSFLSSTSKSGFSYWGRNFTPCSQNALLTHFTLQVKPMCAFTI